MIEDNFRLKELASICRYSRQVMIVAVAKIATRKGVCVKAGNLSPGKGLLQIVVTIVK